MPLPDSQVERVLVVAAHPDDIDFGAGGTIATFTDAGLTVTYLLCTYGDQGGFDDTPREQMPTIRDAEQRAAGAVLGVSDVRFLEGYRDGWLQPTFDLQRDIVRVIRQVRPVRMLIQSPERNWQRIPASHGDHLAAGEASIRAIYPAARNPHAWPELITDEGLEPWTVPEVWLMGHEGSTHLVDVTDTFERKIKALQCHVSQTSHMGDELDVMMRRSAAATATTAGWPSGRLAESFQVVSIH